MLLEIWLLTTFSILAVALTAGLRGRRPSTARHSRDRYSVAAIRARIEREAVGEMVGVRT